MDLSEGFLTLASGLCGTSTFTDMRRILGRSTLTLDEHIARAEALALRNGVEEFAVPTNSTVRAFVPHFPPKN